MFAAKIDVSLASTKRPARPVIQLSSARDTSCQSHFNAWIDAAQENTSTIILACRAIKAAASASTGIFPAALRAELTHICSKDPVLAIARRAFMPQTVPASDVLWVARAAQRMENALNAAISSFSVRSPASQAAKLTSISKDEFARRATQTVKRAQGLRNTTALLVTVSISSIARESVLRSVRRLKFRWLVPAEAVIPLVWSAQEFASAIAVDADPQTSCLRDSA